MTTHQSRFNQAGGASLFIVIFAALLMLVVTMSFVQIMMSDQKQASTMDLSQSAYDSAQAGVEDAKRALLLLNRCGDSTTAECNAVRVALNTPTKDQKCNTVRYALTQDTADKETRVIRDDTAAASGNDGLLNQAYTCAKVTLDTNDYRKTLEQNGDSVLVPLRAKSAFNKVRISWFMSSDAGATTATMPATGKALPQLDVAPASGGWAVTTPSILRTQFMQTGTSFTLDQFDGGEGTVGSNANTVFLYPSVAGLTGSISSGGSSVGFAGLDGRLSGSAEPTEARCNTAMGSGAYACSIILDLPNAVGGGRSNAFLYLTTLYNRASVKVELLQSGAVVPFSGVQPLADVTGRANDVFRRVESRIELGVANYPSAAVDVEDVLCKNFTVTNDTAGYNNGGCGD